MSYVLLKDKHKCPRCQARTRMNHSGHCRNCGLRLFLSPINFTAFEDDGNLRNYWLWTNDRGWIHRDYVMNLRAEAQRADEKIELAERNTDKRIAHEI